MTTTLKAFMLEDLPRMLVPVLILVIGWAVAVALAALVRGGLRRTRLNERGVKAVFGEQASQKIDSAAWGGRVTFWAAMLLVLMVFLESLSFRSVVQPLQNLADRLLGFIPNLLGAAIVIATAWLLAVLARKGIASAMRRWRVDERLDERVGERAEHSQWQVGTTVADAAYWLVLLLFVPAVLDVLQLEGLMRPVQALVDEVLGYLPNLASAALVLLVGWFAARIVQRVVTHLSTLAGVDRLADKLNLESRKGRTVADIFGVVAYGLVLIPVAVAALNALSIDAVTEPASAMLQSFFEAIPAILGALLIITIGYAAARLVATFLENLLVSVGLDGVMERIGWTGARMGQLSPSRLVAMVAMVAVFVFAGVEAASFLGLDTVSMLASDVAVLAAHVFLGLVIFALGLFFSGWAATAIADSAVRSRRVLSVSARVAVLALTGAMALRQMGIADEIIELAFGITLAAAGVAAALAFGLGGREVAAEMLEDLRRNTTARLADPAIGPARRKAS